MGNIMEILNLLRQGEVEAACRRIDRGSILDEAMSVPELVGIGRQLVAYGCPSQAVALLESGSRLGMEQSSPELNAALAWLGIAYLETGSIADADAIYELTRREQETGQFELTLLRARWLQSEGRSGEARRLYQDGLVTYQSTEEIAILLIERGRIRQDQGDSVTAREDWHRAERMAALINDRSLLAWCRRLLKSSPPTQPGPASDQAPQTVAPKLYIHLLGEFAVERGQDRLPIGTWARHKAVALLQFLAIQPKGWAPRERVLDALWGEEASHNALYVTLHSLRQGLNTGLAEPLNYVTLQNGLVGLAPALYLGSDLQQFRSCIQAARTHWGQDRRLALDCYRRAMGICKGELLAGVPDQLWLSPLRETVRQMAIEALVRLAQACATGDETDSLSLWMQLLEIEPGHEQAVREVMLLQWRRGQRAAAHRHFANYLNYVQQELGADPAPDLLTLHGQIERFRGGDANEIDNAHGRTAAHPRELST